MQILKYTITLTSDEMFDLAYALENQIESDLSLTTPLKEDNFFNTFESELKILQEFVSRSGYMLEVSERTEHGTFSWEKKPQYYDNTDEWLKSLLKQRRKELAAKTK